MPGIDTKIIQPSLFLDSDDSLRNEIGGYWSVDEEGTFISFSETTINAVPLSYKSEIDSIYTQFSEAQPIDSSKILPNFSFPIRIAGKPVAVKSDEHWKAIVLGRQWGDKTYPGFSGGNNLQYLNFDIDLPYTKTTAKQLYNLGVVVNNEVTINYNYNQYIPLYERYNIPILETQMLNYYTLADLSRWDNASEAEAATALNIEDYSAYGALGALYDSELLNSISREQTYLNIYNLFNFTDDNIDYIYRYRDTTSLTEFRINNTELLINYLPDFYIQNQLSSSTNNWLSSKMQTVIFDNEAMETMRSIEQYQVCMPYYVNLEMSSDNLGVIGESIIDNKFSSKFLKTMYHAFAGNLDNLIPDTRTYNARSIFLQPNEENVEQITSTESISYKEIDFVDFLVYCHNNYNTSGQNDNCLFIGPKTIPRLSATDETGAYRYFNTQASMAVLNDAVNFVENNVNVKINSLQDFFNAEIRHNEIIAYRVEKIGGPPSGDNNTQNTIQNFWFMNDGNAFNFYDTQVKYNTDYTYNIYKYVLVLSVEYKTQDLALTKQLGCEEEVGSLGTYHGLSFYDPFTDEERLEIFDSSKITTNFKFIPRSQSFVEENSQAFSVFEYLADMNFQYEPALKVIELPVSSKTLKVLDHPGNEVTVRPYQVLGTSRKLGFDFQYEGFNSVVFPSIISTNDFSYRSSYLNANDLQEDELLPYESISNPRFIDVYRIDTKPRTFTDFDKNLIGSADLKIKNERKFTYDVGFFEDDVVPNQKYYYLFRARTQQGLLSTPSVVYEAQLINDGGYFYAIFNTFTEEELQEEQFRTTTKQLKNLFHLQPNLSQLTLNTENVDFSQSASSQLKNVTVGTADDLIWDKTFKIRLTSKKTGKKIDFNVTYKLTSD